MAAADFDCLAFFKEEVASDSAATKLCALSRLNLIASALGPARTVSELVPFLARVVEEEPLSSDDEFMYHMAKQYAVLSDYIDGKGEVLVPPLEHLAAQEETVIRDAAIASLCIVVERQPELVPELLVPALHRLAEKSDFFTARVSACALLPTAYRFATEEQKVALRKAFITLCADVPMVRRAAAHRLKDLVSVCEKADVLADLVPVYTQLSQEDTQDTIRVACVHTTLVMARMFNEEENRQHTLDVITSACEDRSWRVRLTVAKHFDQLCAVFGSDIVASSLLWSYKMMLSDNEPEVRKEAVRVIEPCLQIESPISTEQLQQTILPLFQSLAVDPEQPVRAALAQVMGPIARALGRELTTHQLAPLIADLMQDEFHDVRLNIVSHAGLLCEILSVDGFVRLLLHTVQNLMTDNNWRIRKCMVGQSPKVARLFGMELFQSNLEALVLSSLKDTVHSVRQAAIDNLKEIADAFGERWTVEHLLPKLVEQYSQSASYASRVTTLNVLPQVCGVMSADKVVQFIVPLLVKATQDTVPNVRFTACRTISWMLENHSVAAASINTLIKPSLLELQHDSDIDVQYYASRALMAADRK